jgi:hypothetical protein
MIQCFGTGLLPLLNFSRGRLGPPKSLGRPPGSFRAVETAKTNDSTEAYMNIVAQHRITDLEKFSSLDAAEIAEGAPVGVQLRQFFPLQGGQTAICLWEADSIDTLRDYLDPATAGVSENTYFEVDTERSLGLPEPAAAGA